MSRQKRIFLTLLSCIGFAQTSCGAFAATECQYQVEPGKIPEEYLKPTIFNLLRFSDSENGAPVARLRIERSKYSLELFDPMTNLSPLGLATLASATESLGKPQQRSGYSRFKVRYAPPNEKASTVIIDLRFDKSGSCKEYRVTVPAGHSSPGLVSREWLPTPR